MLICKALHIRQGDFRLTADFSVSSGGITALIGPSGAGKSTLLSAIAGFLPPQGGRVLWDGRDLTRLAPGARPVSILFQDNNLFAHLSVAQNIGLALRTNLRLAAADKDRVAGVLETVGLSGLGDRRPASLSGGQQSRVALARVLLADRPVILLDEPFAALGPALKDEMLELVRRTLAGPARVVLMVTHDPQDAVRVADDVIVVADDVAAAPVATAALFADPPAALAEYLGKR